MGLRGSRSRLVLAGLLAFLVVGFCRSLAVVPPAYEDEPLIASTSYKLATDGVFSSDVFAGLHGMERRCYWFPPVYPLIAAGAIRMGGFGLPQIRLVNLMLAAITLVLTYAIGRKLFSPAVGAVAVAWLLLVGLEPIGIASPTGILFIDAARLARYDVAVPMFGLAALYAYLTARDRDQAGVSRAALAYGLSGFLMSLAVLTHFNALVWAIGLALLALWDRARPRPIIALVIGFLLPCIPYVIYVLGDLGSWVDQTRMYGHRFQPFDPMWYVRNLLEEPFRYGPGLGQAEFPWFLRIGLWSSLILIPSSLVALAFRAAKDRNARALVVPAVILPLLVALLVTQKFRNYKIAFIPLIALAAAWGVWSLWNAARSSPNRKWLRPAIALIATLVVAEGVLRVSRPGRIAANTTPYSDYIARLRTHIPAGARVLGLHNYWIGLEDTNYRSWWVPLALTSKANRSPQQTMESILDAISPEVVLIDRRMRDYLNGPHAANDPRPREISDWLRNWHIAAVVEDSTYGRMDIYRRTEDGGLLRPQD